tara:strand:+ start:3709 stop:4260 length:552 start_codon:yes stop_codon:yes gene_type:complete
MTVSTFFILIVIALAVVAIFNLSSNTSPKQKRVNGNNSTASVGLPYEAISTLFTPAERSFLGVLDNALGNEFRVFGKVRVGDIAKVKSGLGRSANQGAFNKIAYKHFDYIVCRANDLSVVCAIELNDLSHSTKRARKRDELIQGVCEVIALPLMQVTARQSYSTQEILDQFILTIKTTIARGN